MTVGNRIAERRKALGMTQEDLASLVYVTSQAVSQWETGKTEPDAHNLQAIAGALRMSLAELRGEDADRPSFMLREQMFQEDNMYARLSLVARMEQLPQTNQALKFMKKAHDGQYRKNVWFSNRRVPYIVHPLMMACHAHAMGIHDDRVLAAILLHDVCEDCPVEPEELPVDEEVREAVRLLTFVWDPFLTKEEAKAAYYEALKKNPVAAIAKAIDRCNNISTMAASFGREKMVDYAEETDRYVMPLLDYIKEEYVQYSDPVFLIKYHVLSVMETIKNMMMR